MKKVNHFINKNKKLTKKQVNLGGLTKEVYQKLLENPTTKYAIKKTGKSKNSICRTLNKLISLGLITRLSWGHFKVNQIGRVLTQVNQNKEKIKKRISENKLTEDYFRLHNLELCIKINNDHFKKIKNLLFRRKVFKNVRSSGNNGGSYFNIEDSYNDYMLTSENLFLFFARDWSLEADNLKELHNSFYLTVMRELDILQTRYKINCFKDGKVNFDIRNMHIALVRNGIAKEFKNQKLDRLVIYDEVDGKPRYIFDFSNLLNELEAIHPNKAIDDIDKAKVFMTYLKDGITNKVIESGDKFFDGEDIKLSDLKKLIYYFADQVTKLTKENIETASGLNAVVKVMDIKNKLPEENKEKPNYIG